MLVSGRAHMKVRASVGQGICECACFGGARLDGCCIEAVLMDVALGKLS